MKDQKNRKRKLIKQSLFLFGLIVVGTDLLANRLPGLKGKRCDDEISDASICAGSRDEAFQSGCINKEEYDWAVGNSVSVGCIMKQPKYVCPCGCFDAGTLISLSKDDARQVLEVEKLSSFDKVSALATDAYLDAVSLDDRSIIYTTQGPEKVDLYKFQLENGSELTVSQNHGMLLSSGKMVYAKEVSLQDQFVSVDGSSLKILTIDRVPAKNGDVYNLLLNAPSFKEHIVIANGVLVGDLLWQNIYASEMARVSFRK